MSERVEGWQGMENDERVAVLDRLCRDEAAGRVVERL